MNRIITQSIPLLKSELNNVVGPFIYISVMLENAMDFSQYPISVQNYWKLGVNAQDFIYNSLQYALATPCIVAALNRRLQTINTSTVADQWLAQAILGHSDQDAIIAHAKRPY
uniref:Uncharacterized protein n=1 Tax=Moniliophthora roreri TaxID=221103 RepID=A0A0W0G8A9_MONRR